VIMRKKCPYPKTYDPKYEMLLKKELQRIVFEEKGPVADFLNVENMKHMLAQKSNYIRPWFGQLMAGPQLFAYLIQVNIWLEKYGVEIVDI
ncbi:MAG: asparagine synthetase B, partial [Lachnospiraceae bacterium]|nr:asparagine synthetase B [Lachnospiraceae bacterium]